MQTLKQRREQRQNPTLDAAPDGQPQDVATVLRQVTAYLQQEAQYKDRMGRSRATEDKLLHLIAQCKAHPNPQDGIHSIPVRDQPLSLQDSHI